MSVRMNLSIGDELDAWITQKAESLGIAKNAYVIMCVANTRNQEESMKMMNNTKLFNALIENQKEIEEESKA